MNYQQSDSLLITTVSILSLLFVGCATQTSSSHETIWDIAEKQVEAGSYKKAWDTLNRTPSSMTSRTQDFLNKNPKVYEAAMESFSVYRLEEIKERGFKSSLAFRKLDFFEEVSTPTDAKIAQKNVLKVFGKRNVPSVTDGEKIASVTKGTVGAQYGRVAEVQLVNRSHINTGVGANTGSYVGQAMYFDNTSWGNYSAMNQLGAGLLGAAIGSAMDRPTEIRFQRKYWITLNNGETISRTDYGSDATHIPKGICVAVRNSSVTTTNEANCKKK